MVEVVEGGKNARLSAVGDIPRLGPGVEHVVFEKTWPLGITALDTRYGGFHLEQMTEASFATNLLDYRVDFAITSGPKSARIRLYEEEETAT